MTIIQQLLFDFTPFCVILRLLLAALLGGLIGTERERHGRAAGLRTHIAICIGAAITALTSLHLTNTLGYTGDVARLSAQVISGVGFLGAGTILVRNSSVITGLTTAAGVWTTAGIGIAVGYGFYVGALMTTAICIFSVTVLNRLERKHKESMNLYIEITQMTDAELVIEQIRSVAVKLTTCDVIAPKSGSKENVGISCTVIGRVDYEALKAQLCAAGNVAMIIKNLRP